MSKYLIIPLFLLLVGALNAQAQPGSTEPVLKEAETTAAKSESFSKSQLMIQPNNTQAWLNYYQAVSDQDQNQQKRGHSSATQKELNKMEALIAESLPNSYAHCYIAFRNRGLTQDGLEWLKKAYDVDPNQSAIWPEMLARAVFMKNATEVKQFAEKLNTSGIYTAAEWEYNQNVLNSVEPNAVLITYGHVDTYPLFILQEVYQFRKDVTIVCLEWLINPDYRKWVDESLNIKTTENEFNSFKTILDNTVSKNIYVALTVQPDFLESRQNRLYCTGLALIYSKFGRENLIALKSNWENLFNKNKLLENASINVNYILPLIQLYGYYKSLNDTTNMNVVKTYALTIANQHSINLDAYVNE